MSKQFARVEDDDSENGDVGPDVRPLLAEPDRPIPVSRRDLLALLIEADEALDGDSNDAEHDALFSLRESIAGFLSEEN